MRVEIAPEAIPQEQQGTEFLAPGTRLQKALAWYAFVPGVALLAYGSVWLAIASLLSL